MATSSQQNAGETMYPCCSRCSPPPLLPPSHSSSSCSSSCASLPVSCSSCSFPPPDNTFTSSNHVDSINFPDNNQPQSVECDQPDNCPYSPPRDTSSPTVVEDECCAECCPLAAEGVATKGAAAQTSAPDPVPVEPQQQQEQQQRQPPSPPPPSSSPPQQQQQEQPVEATACKRKYEESNDDYEDYDDGENTHAYYYYSMSEQERKACQWAACDEKFQQVDELTTHVCKVHLSSRSVDIHCRWGPCTVTVDASEALFNHLSDHLGQRFLHICGWVNCGQRFETFDELTGHLSEDHVGTGKSRYLCEWQECHRNGKSFTQRQKVMRHIQTHTGDKPYQCTICKKRFSEANIMTQHMRIHTGEKPFRCPEEGCDRTFSISGALKIHRRTHTGERPFTCKYTGCNKKFAESSNLTKHMRVHTGERPFRCSVVPCGKAFSRPDQVSRHLKTHERGSYRRLQK